MTDQNNAPELPARIWAWSEDDDFLRAKPHGVLHGTEYIRADLARADRAAPEGQVRAVVDAAVAWWEDRVPRDTAESNLCAAIAALTPPPAAPTDNTALVEALTETLGNIGAMGFSEDRAVSERIAFDAVKMARKARADYFAALASREAPPAAQTDVQFGRQHFEPKRESDNQPYPSCQQESVTVAEGIAVCEKIANEAIALSFQGAHSRSDLAAMIQKQNADLAAARAEIERLKRDLEITHNSRNELAETWKDRAIKAEAERDALMADPLYIIGVNHGWDEAVENDAAHPAARPIQSMLADAERDMRQRAAEVCDRNNQVSGWVSRDAILALPLKHADREGGSALAQGQKEGD